MHPNQPSVNKKFVAQITADMPEELSKSEVIEWLIHRAIIPNATVNTYMVLSLYHCLIKQTVSKEYPLGRKRETIWAVCDLLGNIEERHVWNILKNHSSRFKPNRKRV